MELHFILAFIALLLFSVCAHQLMRAVRRRIPVFGGGSPYSKAALRVRKGYEVLAFGSMTLCFLALLVQSWIEIFAVFPH